MAVVAVVEAGDSESHTAALAEEVGGQLADNGITVVRNCWGK